MIRKRTAQDYKFIRLLGEGSFSSVYLAVEAVCCDPSKVTTANSNSNNQQPPLSSTVDTTKTVAPTTSLSNQTSVAPTTIPTDTTSLLPQTSAQLDRKIRKFAIKVCQKSHIKRQNKQAAVMREKEIMNILNQHPNKHFIKLYCTFQDFNRLFFVMTLAQNGELLTYMQEHPLSLSSTRKYTRQLLEALEHLHRLGIVHRDLKPENILLDERLDILITDFGSAKVYSSAIDGSPYTTSDIKQQDKGDSSDPSKQLETKQERKNSFVGTAQYASPEMLLRRHATNKSDLWALGVIIYQMITNVMPFNAPNEYLIYQKIINLDYDFPDDFDETANDLVRSLIKLEPQERLGAFDDLTNEGYVSIRGHKFLTNHEVPPDQHQDSHESGQNTFDQDLGNLDKIKPGLDESQLLRLLTVG